jgi:60 kDa SS-A/Ro ribonucleoprotein
MANKNLFKTVRGKLIPRADTRNRAGGKAYSFSPKHGLAQYAATGCLGRTFYASAEEQLDETLALAAQLPPEFVAKCAVFARRKAFLKDMPALLLASLATRDTAAMKRAFPLVVDNGRMLRNFVQVMRSGVTGRKSLGTAPKRLVLNWLESRTDEQIFRDSVGNDPSLADIVKMVHPKPTNTSRAALYSWLVGKRNNAEALPEIVVEYEAYKGGDGGAVPDVPFQMLTSLPLGRAEWADIARTAGWQMTRMNLNTFARQGVFEVPGMAHVIASRLSDADLVRRARAFPYQLMIAWRSVGNQVPAEVRDALQDAMEVAIENVPTLPGKTYILVDVSGSMDAAVTGERGRASSAVRCRDVAALMAASVVRRNPCAEVIPFHTKVELVDLNPRDSVMTNAAVLSDLPSGGTDCSAPLRYMNQRKSRGDTVIFVSDSESWMDAHRGGGGTAVMEEWRKFTAPNPGAKLVCVDLAPNNYTQAAEADDILNVGGFSDQVFDVVAAFAEGKLGGEHWVGEIEAIEL